MAAATIRQVAKMAGVSIATVSRCLNAPDTVSKKTLTKVRKVIADTGYTPNSLAQNFRKGKTNVIMVVVPDVGIPFFMELLEGIHAVLQDKYSVVLTEARDDVQNANNFIDMMISKQVEGVILLASLLPFSPQLIDAHKSHRLPLVIGLEPLTEDLEKLPSVHIDNHQAAFEATRYLTDIGHKAVAFVSGQAGSPITRDREKGFRDAMAAAGLPIIDGFVHYADLTIPGGMSAAQSLLNKRSRPTAIFCANDDMALGVMHAARKAGVDVPGQMSVMGFDDTRYADISNPSLSTVHQPAREIGLRVAQRLLDAIESPEEVEQRVEILPHKLVIRESTRRPPG